MLFRKLKSHETDPNILSVARNCPKHTSCRTKLISHETKLARNCHKAYIYNTPHFFNSFNTHTYARTYGFCYQFEFKSKT